MQGDDGLAGLGWGEWLRMGCVRCMQGDDHPFIVLTETKFSFRCIPVGIGTLLTGLGSKKEHM